MRSEDKLVIGAIAALAGGTLLAALLADRHTKSRRRERSTVFYDNGDSFNDDESEEEVDLPDSVDLEDESSIREARPTTRRRKVEYPPDEILRRLRRLVAILEPSQSELSRYASHQHTVARRLETALSATVLAVGSHARSTYLRKSSDLDLFAVLPVESTLWGGARKSSIAVLKSLKRELEQRYRDTTIGKSGPSVTLHFGGGDFIVDVVPAVQVDGRHSDIYEIPSSDGGWLRTNPVAHNKYLQTEDRASNGKLRRISMLVKYWARCRTSISMHSFTTEMILAESGICRGVKTYGQLLCDAFSCLFGYAARSFEDPLGISGALMLASTPSKREKLKGVVQTTLARLESAMAAEEAGRIAEAVGHYQVVFNRNFPATP